MVRADARPPEPVSAGGRPATAQKIVSLFAPLVKARSLRAGVIGDYHPFPWASSSSPSAAGAAVARTAGRGGLEEGIVVSRPLKRKAPYGKGVTAESSECMITTPGFYKRVGNPPGTPISGKIARTYKSQVKSSNAGPHKPISNAGSPVNPPTPVSCRCRYDSSLAVLTKKFINLLKEAQDGILDLNNAAKMLDVKKRRIYDITHVLDGIGLTEKIHKNRIRWKALNASETNMNKTNVLSVLETEFEKLNLQEQALEEHISEIREKLQDLTEDESNQRWLYLTKDDIKGLHCFQDQTLIAIKAPHGTSLEVPEPNVKVGNTYQRRYKIIIRSTMGPIDVHLVSKYEEKMGGQEVGVATPSRKNSAKHAAIDATRTITGQRSGTEESDADYWLLTDGDVSITDMWRPASQEQWDQIDPMDFSDEESSTPHALKQQPAAVGEPTAVGSN